MLCHRMKELLNYLLCYYASRKAGIVELHVTYVYNHHRHGQHKNQCGKNMDGLNKTGL